MASYLTMQTRISDEVLNAAVTTSHIKNAIQTAIGYYENTTFYFNQKTSTFNTVSGQELYTATDLPAIPNIFELRNSTVALSGIKSPLLPVDYDVIDNEQTGSVTGFPYWMSVWEQKIRLYPIPDNTYVVTLSYIQQFSTLSADGDTNAWTTEAEELIRQRAKYILAMDVIIDESLAARATKMGNDAFDSLLTETRQRMPNKQLRIPAMISGGRSFNINRGF